MKLANQLGVILSTFLCLILTIAPANAEESQSILERLTGTWIATGNSFGSDITTEMTW